jgi:integrase
MSLPDRLPAYRHYKPKKLGVVRLDGRDVYLGRYNSPESHEKYRRVVAEWLTTGIAAKSAKQPAAQEVDAGPAVSEILLAFMRHAQAYYRHTDGTPTGEDRHFAVSLRPLRELYGSTPARDFGPKGLLAVRQVMIDAGMRRKVINKRVRRVVAVFRWAVEAELIPGEVHHRLKAVKALQRGRSDAKESTPVRTISDEVVDATLAHLPRQVQAMVELQRLTGARPGEICVLRTGDIDRTGTIWTFTPRDHKTSHHGHERTIYFGPRAQQILAPWLRADPDAFLFSPRDVMREISEARRAARKTPLSPSQKARQRKKKPRRTPGERYTTHSYHGAIVRACGKAFPHPTIFAIAPSKRTAEQRAQLREWDRGHAWHPHRLRHNAATWLRKEFGVDIARIILGHTSPVVTEIYAELDREKALAVVAKIG